LFGYGFSNPVSGVKNKRGIGLQEVGEGIIDEIESSIHRNCN